MKIGKIDHIFCTIILLFYDVNAKNDTSRCHSLVHGGVKLSILDAPKWAVTLYIFSNVVQNIWNLFPVNLLCVCLSRQRTM